MDVLRAKVGPRVRVRGMRAALRPLRMAWRRLTSMRTALVLLFLLAVAAVPGSLLPQRPLNPAKAASYIASHGAWGSFLDSPRDVRRLRLGVVRGHLPAAVRLARRLPGAAHPACTPARWSASRCPHRATWTGCPKSEPVRDVLPAGGVSRAAARAALGRRWRVEQRAEAVRGGHAVGREGLQPRDREPDLPHRAAGLARAHRDRPALHLRGHDHRQAGRPASATASSTTTRGGRAGSPPRARCTRRRSASTS